MILITSEPFSKAGALSLKTRSAAFDRDGQVVTEYSSRDSRERTLIKTDRTCRNWTMWDCSPQIKFQQFVAFTCNLIHQACKQEAAKMFVWKKKNMTALLCLKIPELRRWGYSSAWPWTARQVNSCRKYLMKTNGNLCMEDLGEDLQLQSADEVLLYSDLDLSQVSSWISSII